MDFHGRAECYKDVSMSKPWDLITALATAALALATLVVGYFAYGQIKVIEKQIDDGVNARRAQEFLELRKNFLEIDEKLDAVNRHIPYADNNFCPAWNLLKRYWYFTETEWQMARIDTSQQQTWIDSQKPRVMHALTEASFRSVFAAMAKRSFKTSEGEKFVEEMRSGFAEFKARENIEAPELDSDPPFPTCPATSMTVQSEASLAACSCTTADRKTLPTNRNGLK
jgi:hypothetical protein